jgi:hypothetical protein
VTGITSIPRAFKVVDLEPVPLESDPAGVGVIAVDLDREVKLGPEEVDLIAVDEGVGFEACDPGPSQQPQQLDLGRGAGALRSAGEIEDPAQPGVAAVVRVAGELVL